MPRTANHDVKALFGGGRLSESPRRHDGAWWVADFYQHPVCQITPDGCESVVFDLMSGAAPCTATLKRSVPTARSLSPPRVSTSPTAR